MTLLSRLPIYSKNYLFKSNKQALQQSIDELFWNKKDLKTNNSKKLLINAINKF